MRLDLFLKLSRLIKRRTLAKEYCEHSLVEVNHQPAKAAKEVRIGDEITLKFRNRTVTVEVLDLPQKGIRAREAAKLYRVLSECRKEEPDDIF
ncbi:MAG: RNA-binding S4 domain-containing protein [bacterium]|nr:RNA-binding S4 domain-containing protein [bacterium]